MAFQATCYQGIRGLRQISLHVTMSVLYFEQPLSLDECRAVRAEVEGPLMGTTGLIKPPPSVQELEEVGYACAFYPGLMPGAGQQAAWEYAHDFLARGHEAQMEWQNRSMKYPMPHFFDLVGFPAIFEWEEKYLPPEEVKEKYATSVGGYDPRKLARTGS